MNIATATIYKALDILAAKIPELHHNLFSAESDIIKDYENEAINKILEKCFKKNNIRDFEIEEMSLQIL